MLLQLQQLDGDAELWPLVHGEPFVPGETFVRHHGVPAEIDGHTERRDRGRTDRQTGRQRDRQTVTEER